MAVLAVLVAAGIFLCRRVEFGYVRLTSGDSAAATTQPPTNTIVLNVAEAETITPPFECRGDIEAATGRIVALTDGHGSSNQQGRIELPFVCAEAGRYQAWTRARWYDACGNSIALSVSNAPPFTAGQNAVYSTWHWVKSGMHTLAQGTNTLMLHEREDGIELDQVVLTPDKTFVPSGMLGGDRETVDARHFGDDFARSPGHGLQHWQPLSGKWDINFTLDPNRIPNQYSFVAALGVNDSEAVVLVDDAPWRGCRTAVSFTTPGPCRLGIILADSDGDGNEGEAAMRIAIDIGATQSVMHVTGAGIDSTQDVSGRVQTAQWHRLVVDRWAWVLRVSIDGHTVLTEGDLPPRMVQPGLFVTANGVAFDDVAVEEILWQADDGGSFRIPWTVRDGAEWFRRRPSRESGCALKGRKGVISASLADLPVREMLIDGDGMPEAEPDPGFVETRCGTSARLIEVADEGDGHQVFTAGIEAPPDGIRLRRVAVRYGTARADVFRDGPYHFTKSRVPDPSDYLDFTEKEIKAIMTSPEVDKLKRGKKLIPIVGNPITGSFWYPQGGRWFVKDGVLTGLGPGGVRYWKEIISDMDVRLKVRRGHTNCTAEVVLYEGLGSALSVALGNRGEDAVYGADLTVPVPVDDAWHDVHIQCRPHRLAARVDGAEWHEARAERGLGGGVLLVARQGIVQFDDVEMEAPRRSPDCRTYAFDRVETDWWREGQAWVDHGGFSCMVASSWISLIASTDRGILWNKDTFGQDVAVSFMVQENSEWYGWKKKPSHLHFPYDNICLLLSKERDFTKGYRLELNTRNRKATVLYRDNVEVATVAQDALFPIRYVGGHGPYEPRSNQVSVWKQGGKLTVVLNAKCILEYTDPSPLAIGRIGVGGYTTRANFAHIQVREL